MIDQDAACWVEVVHSLCYSGIMSLGWVTVSVSPEWRGFGDVAPSLRKLGSPRQTGAVNRPPLCLLAACHLFFSLCNWSINETGGFPGSWVVESACNAGDTGSIPGWGRCPGEGNGNPLQYSCLENPRQERGERLLAAVGFMLISPSVWKIPWTDEPGRLQSMGSQRVRYDLATKS